jgi:hypothetical protein
MPAAAFREQERKEENGRTKAKNRFFAADLLAGRFVIRRLQPAAGMVLPDWHHSS